MHPSRQLEYKPRVHRVDFIGHCALSDCCGAPIIQGGICFECREQCEEVDDDPRPAHFDPALLSDQDRIDVTDIENTGVSPFAEGDSDEFDEMSMMSPAASGR